MRGKLPARWDFHEKSEISKQNIPTSNRLWMDSECIICIRFAKKKKKKTGNRQKWAKNAPFASVFQNFSRGDPDPSSPHCEIIILIKNSPLALYDPLQLRWIFSCITYIEDRSFEGKNTHNFFGKNRHELGKNGLRMHNLHPFFKNFLGETPSPPPPLLREDKQSPLWLYMIL